MIEEHILSFLSPFLRYRLDIVPFWSVSLTFLSLSYIPISVCTDRFRDAKVYAKVHTFAGLQTRPCGSSAV